MTISVTADKVLHLDGVIEVFCGSQEAPEAISLLRGYSQHEKIS